MFEVKTVRIKARRAIKKRVELQQPARVLGEDLRWHQLLSRRVVNMSVGLPKTDSEPLTN